MKKTILALVLVAGLTSFAGNAKAAIVFQNLDQTILAGQTFNFGFNGSTITTGSGGYSVSYSSASSVTYPGFGTFTNPAGMTFQTPGYPQYIYAGKQFRGGGVDLVAGLSVNGLDSGWSSGRSVSLQNAANQSIWLAIQGNGSYNGWAELSYNNNNGVIGAVAFTTGSGDIRIGDTGNGMYTPVVLQNVAVPEPSTYALFAFGTIGMLMVMRRKKTV